MVNRISFVSEQSTRSRKSIVVCVVGSGLDLVYERPLYLRHWRRTLRQMSAGYAAGTVTTLVDQGGGELGRSKIVGGESQRIGLFYIAACVLETDFITCFISAEKQTLKQKKLFHPITIQSVPAVYGLAR